MMKGANEALPRLREKLSKYAMKDIFNANEFGLNYHMAPDTTIACQRIPGRKKAKELISVLVCANADGSENLEFLIIVNSFKPRTFKKKTGYELGFDYHSNGKA